MPTATYTASMITRKSNSASNTNSSCAMQEFYTSGTNYCGVVHFSGMSLANKVITEISIRATSSKAGYGAGSTKTVYVRKSNYQNTTASATGANYCGDALGTFSGSFYDNTTTVPLTGDLLTNLATYFASGKNTFCIYNPSPSAGSQGYSRNYLQWTNVTMTVTYTEGVSKPTVSSNSVDLGSSVTITTNRLSSSATHTLTYAFGGTTGTIATGVGASKAWTPPLTLAGQIPSATSGLCTITCATFVGSTQVGTSTVALTLNVPSTVVPTINSVTYAEAANGIEDQFGCFVRTRSQLSVSISASGSQGSTIASYRTTLDGTAYTSASFTSGTINTAGTVTMTVTATDSRGRTASTTRDITVADYSPPSLTMLRAERCNTAGTAAQVDGTKVRVSLAGSVSAVDNKNTVSCIVYYKLSTASAWTQAATITASNYAVSASNLLLSGTFDVLKSYDVKVKLTDFFYNIEQSVSVGTKQVLMDFYKDGNGIAFGKVAESAERVEFGWPLVLSSALGIAQGGTGATTAAGARNALGLGNTSGALPIANGGTGATTAAAARNALGLGNTTGALPVANGGTGSTTAAGAITALGITAAGIGAAASTHQHAAGDITSGTINAARLPFKVAYGSSTVSGSTAASINYSSTGFTAVPKVVVSYSTTSSNWSGDNGALKVHSKTKTGCTIIVGGSFNTSRAIDWIAIGV